MNGSLNRKRQRRRLRKSTRKMAKRGGRGKPTQAMLDRLGRQFEGVMRADLKGAFSTFAKGVSYDDVADAVYSGNWRKVFDTLPLDELQAALGDGMQGAGRALVRASEVEAETFATMTLPEGGIARPSQLSVGTDNDQVHDYLITRTGELIQNVTQDLQINVQQAVFVGVEDRLSPRQVAGLIRDKLPLNERQQRSFEKYRDAMEATNLPAKRKRELTERYRNALVDERATTIARTETQYAINQAAAITWDNARRAGLISMRSMKQWVCEAEPCGLCVQLGGVKVGMYEQFTVPSNGLSVPQPPLHVNCRCSAFLIPDGEL